jgi:hypothetical protein
MKKGTNMFKLINSAIFLLLIGSSLLFSQSKESKSAYISVHSGFLHTSKEDFDKAYDSKWGLVYGLGFGVPLSTRTLIYVKATLFATNGTSSYRVYNDDTSMWEYRNGTANFTEWIYNGGVLYNIFLNIDWTMGVNGGLTYTSISEEQKKQDGRELLSKNGSSLGLFIGGSIEKNFSKSPFSVFFETQYNLPLNEISDYIGNYGGLNLNLGFRYYFKNRRLE